MNKLSILNFNSHNKMKIPIVNNSIETDSDHHLQIKSKQLSSQYYTIISTRILHLTGHTEFVILTA